MSEQARIHHPKERILSTDVEGFDSLFELTPDMHSARLITHRDGVAVPLEEAHIQWRR